MKMSPHSGNCRGRDRTERCSIWTKLSAPTDFGAKLLSLAQKNVGRGKQQQPTQATACFETAENISSAPTGSPSSWQTVDGPMSADTNATTGVASTPHISKTAHILTTSEMRLNGARYAIKTWTKPIVTVGTRLKETIFMCTQMALGFAAPAIAISINRADVGSNTPEPWEAPNADI